MSVAPEESDRFGTVYDATCVTAYDLALRMLRDPRRAELALETAYADIWSRLPPAQLEDPRVLVEVLVSVRRAARELDDPGGRD